MNEIYVLIVIDVDGALAAGSAMNNAYLVDNNGFLGSWNEGTPALTTICQDGQVLTWSVAPVQAEASVALAGFSGAMVADGVCAPVASEPVGPSPWSGRVESRGQFAAYAYTVALSIDGRSFSLNGLVKIV